MTAAAVVRSLRAERIRTGGLSRLWAVTVPAAIAIPAAITVGIALVAEAFARIPGQISVLQVSTSNAAYWVITITTTLVAVAAADGQASENRYSTAEHVRLALQSRLSVLFGRWLFYAGLGAVVAAVARRSPAAARRASRTGRHALPPAITVGWPRRPPHRPG